jgi:putative transposase
VSFRAYQVVEALDEIAQICGQPKCRRVDNGPEFAGQALDQ